MHFTHEQSINPPVRASTNSERVKYGGRAQRANTTLAAGYDLVGWYCTSACIHLSLKRVSMGMVLRCCDNVRRAAVFDLPSHAMSSARSIFVVGIYTTTTTV